MTEESGRTLVCSVLFLDIIGYSKHAVTEQYEIKRRFNGVVASALDVLQRRDRVVVDTGDGAAIVFLGDPEDALVVGVAIRGQAERLPHLFQIRMGINLGPVKLINDLNDQVNVIGDGINVAQRVMSFAGPGQLLVSSNYHDVVSRVSPAYAGLFTREGVRQDKHVREHEVWSVSEDLRIGEGESLTDDLPQDLAATGVYRKPEEPSDVPGLPAPEPARIIDAGQHLMISGPTRGSVQGAVDRLVGEGAAVLSPISLVGAKWVASCTHPGAPNEVKVEEFGLTRIVSSRNRTAVEDRVAEIVSLGGRLRAEVEQVDGLWTAVCDV